MNLDISFTFGSFENAGEVFTFVSKFINHPLTAIYSAEAFDVGDWIDSKHEYNDIAKKLCSPGEKWFTVHDGNAVIAPYKDDTVSLITYIKDQNYKCEEIKIRFRQESFFDLEGLTLAATKYKFNIAFKFDWAKSQWQSELFPSNFEVEGKDYSYRKTISHPQWAKSWGAILDIRMNPGRQIRTYAMQLMAAPEIWFGPAAWMYFNQEQIKNCNALFEKQMLADELLYVKLFDVETTDYEAPEILRIQREFRQCSGMDIIEERLNSLLSFPTYY